MFAFWLQKRNFWGQNSKICSNIIFECLKFCLIIYLSSANNILARGVNWVKNPALLDGKVSLICEGFWGKIPKIPQIFSMQKFWKSPTRKISGYWYLMWLWTNLGKCNAEKNTTTPPPSSQNFHWIKKIIKECHKTSDPLFPLRAWPP